MGRGLWVSLGEWVPITTAAFVCLVLGTVLRACDRHPVAESCRGMWPPVAENDHNAWTIGPMARRVKDLELVLPFFLKPQTDNRVPPLLNSDQVAIKELKVRFLAKWNHGFGTPTSEIQDAVAASARALQQRGAVVEGIPNQFHRIGAATVAWVLERAFLADNAAGTDEGVGCRAGSVTRRRGQCY